MPNSATYIITGGGTGGHLVIAKTLAQTLRKTLQKDHPNYENFRIVFIGSQQGQDKMWFENSDDFDACYFLNTTGVVNQKGINKIFALGRIFLAYLQALKHVSTAKAVISVGGFSAAAASFAALTLRKPFFIHEQNATLGRLNKLLKPYTTGFYSSYESTVAIKDYPINEALFQTQRVRETIKTVIFLGGSQGATFINDLALTLAPYLQEKGIHIIHQCGSNDFERVHKAYEALNMEVTCFAFTNTLSAYLQQADLAITRAGASTLWELSANALPAFYVPYPYAANDHQSANAAFLVNQNLAWCAQQSDDLYLQVLDILDENVKSKSEGLSHAIKPQGAQHIINDILTKVI